MLHIVPYCVLVRHILLSHFLRGLKLSCAVDSLSYRQSKYKAIPIVKRHTVHTKKQQCETAVHTIVIVSTADSDEHEHAPLCSKGTAAAALASADT